MIWFCLDVIFGWVGCEVLGKGIYVWYRNLYELDEEIVVRKWGGYICLKKFFMVGVIYFGLRNFFN